MINKLKPSRKTIRLKDFDYSSAGYYFVTLVSHQRKKIFGEITEGKIGLNQVGVIAEETWESIPLHFPNIKLDSFIVMPNHFHGIIQIKETGAGSTSTGSTKNQPLGVVIGSFKSAVTKRVHGLGLLVHERIWQRNYHEHIIRDELDYHRILDYIEQNPVNWLYDEENMENP